MAEAKKIAIINNKGGSAKTTTAVNLAGAYANNYPNRKVLIVETDGQGNATRSFNLNSKSFNQSMYDIFMGNNTPEECVINVYENIDLIPANNAMNFVEFDMMNRFGDEVADNVVEILNKEGIPISRLNEDSLKSIIRSQTVMSDNYFNMLSGKFDNIVKEYDLVIFDTPPEIKAVTSSILAISDEVIIPFEPETYSIDGIMNILSRIADIKENKNNDLNIAGLLAVKVRNNTKLHIDTINSVMKYCNKNNLYYFETEIPNSIRFGSATGYSGVPATISQKTNSFVKSYYSLLDELLQMGVL